MIKGKEAALLERARASDPNTPPLELALWAPRCPDAVRANPVLPLLALEDPGFYRAIQARLDFVTYFQKRTAPLAAWKEEGLPLVYPGSGWTSRELDNLLAPPAYGLCWGFALGCATCRVFAPVIYKSFPRPDVVEHQAHRYLWDVRGCEHLLRIVREVPPRRVSP